MTLTVDEKKPIAIGNNAISVNGDLIGSTDFTLDSSNALEGGYFVLRRGKKMFHLVKLK